MRLHEKNAVFSYLRVRDSDSRKYKYSLGNKQNGHVDVCDRRIHCESRCERNARHNHHNTASGQPKRKTTDALCFGGMIPEVKLVDVIVFQVEECEPSELPRLKIDGTQENKDVVRKRIGIFELPATRTRSRKKTDMPNCSGTKRITKTSTWIPYPADISGVSEMTTTKLSTTAVVRIMTARKRGYSVKICAVRGFILFIVLCMTNARRTVVKTENPMRRFWSARCVRRSSTVGPYWPRLSAAATMKRQEHSIAQIMWPIDHFLSRLSLLLSIGYTS